MPQEGERAFSFLKDNNALDLHFDKFDRWNFSYYNKACERSQRRVQLVVTKRADDLSGRGRDAMAVA